MNKLRRRLSRLIPRILWEGDSWGKDIDPKQRPVVWFTRNGWQLWLSANEAREYYEAVDSLERHESIGNLYSRKAIEEAFQTLLVGFVDTQQGRPDNRAIAQVVGQWLDELLAAEEHLDTVYVVIENLVLKEPQRIGQTLFRPLSDETSHEVISDILSRIDANSYYADDEERRESLKQRVVEELVDYNPAAGVALASVEVTNKDWRRGQQVAIQRIDESLDLLRYIGAFSHRGVPRPIGIRGQVATKIRVMVSRSDEHWHIMHDDVKVRYELNRPRPNFMAYGKLEAVINKDPNERTGLENKLVASLRWFSQAVDERAEAPRLLKLWIALETLLSGTRESGLGSVIADRLAFLLEDELEARREVARLVRAFYKERNRITHQGQTETEDAIRHYALSLAGFGLARVADLAASNSWSTFNDLRDYVEDIKYR